MDKEKEIYHKSLELDAIKEGCLDNVVEIMAKAVDEAINRGIKANTIIIDEKLRYVKPFAIGCPPTVSIFPPMIMGMELKVSKLPDGADFILFEARQTEEEKKIFEIKKQAVKEFAEKLKAQIVLADDIDLYPHYADGYNRACEAISDKIEELIKELYGED